MSSLPARVVVREVGLRDGRQSIAAVAATERKKEWIRAAPEAGLRAVGSSVPARLLPQLADTAALVTYAKTLPDLFVSVAVPNLNGAERALAMRADLLLVPLSASRAHSLANLRKAPDEVMAAVARIRAARAASEDLVFMLTSMGIATGIDLELLLALRAKVAGWLASETLHGTAWRPGLPKAFRPPSIDLDRAVPA